MTLQAKHDKISLPCYASALSKHRLLDSLGPIHPTRDSEIGQLGGWDSHGLSGKLRAAMQRKDDCPTEHAGIFAVPT